MLLFLLPTPERWFDLLIATVIIAWGIYKKEVQDFARSFFSGLHQRFFLRNVVLRLTDEDISSIKKASLGPLRSWLLVLLKEHEADRVTVTEFVKTDAGYLANCLSEAVALEMYSVVDEMQNMPVEEELVDEMHRIHQLNGRWLFVTDARSVEVATLRDALLNSDVHSAFYQSLPTSKGKPWAILAVSWRTERMFSPAQLESLHRSGLGCAYVLQSSAAWKKTKKP